MFDPKARQEIGRAGPDEACTFVIEWREQPTQELFNGSLTKRQRLERLISFHSAAKAALTEVLVEAGFDVTDLPSSSQLVATAPARVWRQLLPQLQQDPKLTVLSNRMYTAV